MPSVEKLALMSPDMCKFLQVPGGHLASTFRVWAGLPMMALSQPRAGKKGGWWWLQTYHVLSGAGKHLLEEASPEPLEQRAMWPEVARMHSWALHQAQDIHLYEEGPQEAAVRI